VTRSATTHYLNSEFDLSLRPRPRQLRRPRLERQVCELSAQALLGAAEGDAALVRVELPRDYLDHLAACGVSVPRLLRHPKIDPLAQLRPFGWSAEAIALNRLHRRSVPHPSLAIVRKVNSRSFARELELDHEAGAPLGALVSSPDELRSFLSSAPTSSEWVIKAEHGHAGLANRRVRGSGLAEADRRFVEDRFAEDDLLIIEPWFHRERDWCVVFEAPFDAASLRIHETVCTRDGALIGALFEPGDGSSAPFKNDLAAMAQRVASRLVGEGYLGPVSVDAFSWSDGARAGLRPFVDLNCRLSMSDGAYRLWRRTARDRAFYYRFFSRRRLIAFPAELSRALAALGRQRYDRASRLGILLASPLRVAAAGEFRQPGKLAVIFVARDHRGVRELEQWFRGRFEA